MDDLHLARGDNDMLLLRLKRSPVIAIVKYLLIFSIINVRVVPYPTTNKPKIIPLKIPKKILKTKPKKT